MRITPKVISFYWSRRGLFIHLNCILSSYILGSLWGRMNLGPYGVTEKKDIWVSHLSSYVFGSSREGGALLPSYAMETVGCRSLSLIGDTCKAWVAMWKCYKVLIPTPSCFLPSLTSRPPPPIALCCLSCQLNLSLILSAVTLFIPNSGISKAVKVFMGVQMRDSQSKVNL